MPEDQTAPEAPPEKTEETPAEGGEKPPAEPEQAAAPEAPAEDAPEAPAEDAPEATEEKEEPAPPPLGLLGLEPGAPISMRNLIEVGLHFGHQAPR